jgi:hypothetical protein
MNLKQLPAEIRRGIQSAPLPANYEAAKRAIKECAHIDECKEWADKAIAIASYARQLKDSSMKEAAERIHLRAQERIGELLLALYPNRRWKTATSQGLSQGQASMAMNIAKVPKAVRDEKIEASPPIKPRRLADLGNPIKGPPPQFLNRHPPATLLGGHVGAFIRWIEQPENAPANYVRSISPADIHYLLQKMRSLVEWIDELELLLQNRTSHRP